MFLFLNCLFNLQNIFKYNLLLIFVFVLCCLRISISNHLFIYELGTFDGIFKYYQMDLKKNLKYLKIEFQLV